MIDLTFSIVCTQAAPEDDVYFIGAKTLLEIFSVIFVQLSQLCNLSHSPIVLQNRVMQEEDFAKCKEGILYGEGIFMPLLMQENLQVEGYRDN